MADYRDLKDDPLFEEFCRQHSGMLSTSNKIAVAGSIPEVSPMFHSQANADLDIDIMFYHQDLVALPPKQPHIENCRSGFKQPSIVIIETDSVHPGYARLLQLATGSCEPSRYIRREELTAKNCCSLKDTSLVPYSKPAMTLIFPRAWLRGICISSQNDNTPNMIASVVLTGFDVVPCICSPLWPDAAAEWVTRKRHNVWPSQTLIDQCVQSGCAFVAKAHKQSIHPHNEFRFSFSASELLLIRSWLPIQKFIYNTLKLIKKQFSKSAPADDTFILCSYHFKTLMFWACETKPAEFWNEANIIEATQSLLYEMKDRLAARELCHYFIRTNNLFDDIAFTNETEFETEFEVLRRFDELVQDIPQLYAERLRPFQSTFVSFIPRNVLLMIQLLLGSKMDALDVVKFESADVYRALRSQLDCHTNADLTSTDKSERLQTAQRNFRRAVTIENPIIKLSIPYEEDFVTCVQHADILDKSVAETELTTSGRTLIYSRKMVDCFPDSLPRSVKNKFAQHHTDRYKITPELYCALANLIAIPDDLKHGENVDFHIGKLLLDAPRRLYCDGVIADTVAKGTGMRSIHCSWLRSMAYFANFHYTTRRDYQAAIDVCNEALNHVDYCNRCSIPIYFSEMLYAVTLSNRLSPVFDESLQCIIGCMTLVDYCNSDRRTKSVNVSASICATEFIYYIKLRCLRQLGDRMQEMTSTVDKLLNHIQYEEHLRFNMVRMVKPLLVFCCGREIGLVLSSGISDQLFNVVEEDACRIC